MNKKLPFKFLRSHIKIAAIAKISSFVLGGALLLVIIYLVLVAIADGPTTMYRMLTSGNSTINTFKIFPYRTITAGKSTSTIGQSKIPSLLKSISFSANGQQYDTKLDDMLAQTNTQAFIVIRNNSLVYERYFNGTERSTLFTSFSITKSITSALIGAAIDEGKIKSVNDQVVKYIPELKGKGFDTLTIRDMLLMSSGIAFQPDDGVFPLLLPFESDDAKQYYTSNLRQLVLQARPSSEPIGASFHYNDYYSVLEGLILERVAHKHVSQYLEDKLWKPLGAEYAATWSLDSVSDGLEKTNSAFNARAIDFARFGLLYLNHGYWNDKQIISGQWVATSTVPDPLDHRSWGKDTSWQEAGGYYKYHWWGLKNSDGTYDYMALGKYNQIIYISPSTKTIVVRFGEGDQSYPWPFAIRALVNSLP